MTKRKFGAWGEYDLIDELRSDQLIEGRIDLQPLQHVETELRADDRCRAQRSLGRWVEPVDTRGDRRLQGGGHADICNGLVADVVSAPAGYHVPFDQIAHDLFSEKRVTRCPVRDH